jgi:hypothetical protein
MMRPYLSCELAARFYVETGDFASSLEHVNLAHKRYSEWGCVAKANRFLSFLASNSINNQQVNMT